MAFLMSLFNTPKTIALSMLSIVRSKAIFIKLDINNVLVVRKLSYVICTIKNNSAGGFSGTKKLR